MTGSGTFSLYKSSGDNKGYNLFTNESEFFFNNSTYGFQTDDIITISGTALGGQSPDNDATIYVNSILNGVIDTFEIFDAGTGYEDGYYYVSTDGGYAQVYITTASGSVTAVTLINGGFGYVVEQTCIIESGNNDASIHI